MIIKINKLKLNANIGVYQWEKDVDREITINLSMDTSNETSSLTDKLEDTIDYDEIVTKIKNKIKSGHFNLIEKLAGDILEDIMQDKRINECRIRIDKNKVFDDVESFAVILSKKKVTES